MSSIDAPHDEQESSTSGQDPVARLGFWSSIAVAVLALAWFGLFLFQVLTLPQGWFGIEEFAARFTSAELANLWPALPLAWTYLLMLASLHYLVGEERRVWTLGALALGVVYSTMATINYLIQIVAIAPNLQAGELEGLHLWAGANFDSIFWALALCYGVMALSMLVAAPALANQGTERVVRRFMILVGISAPFQFGFAMFDWPEWVGAPATGLWVIGVPGAAISLARVFRARRVGLP